MGKGRGGWVVGVTGDGYGRREGEGMELRLFTAYYCIFFRIVLLPVVCGCDLCLCLCLVPVLGYTIVVVSSAIMWVWLKRVPCRLEWESTGTCISVP